MKSSVHKYIPYGTAKSIFSARDDELLYYGPAGTGKSRACLEKLHLMCLQNPEMKALMVRKTLTSLTSSGVQTYRQHVAKEALASRLVVWFGGSKSEPAAFRYSNGSTISIAGMDNPEKIQSSEYDVIYIQEATDLNEDDWEFCSMRLRNGRVSFQQLIADCNPNTPTHWLNQRRQNGKVKSIRSRFEDNPLYVNQDDMTYTEQGEAYMNRLKANLTGAKYQRFIMGEWVAAEGLVYSDYDEEIHLRMPLQNPPTDWPLYLSIDFGYTNPFVCQFWLEDPDGRLFLWKEIYQTQLSIEDAIPLIQKEIGNRRVEVAVCDHSPGDIVLIKKRLGIRAIEAKKDVSVGLQLVMSRLKIQGDGKPRLYICRDAIVNRDKELSDSKRPTCTQEEIVGYVWDEKKDAPVKKGDHGMDAMRYMIAYRDMKNRGVRMGWGV